MRLSENANLPFDKLMALSKVEGLRYPRPSPCQILATRNGEADLTGQVIAAHFFVGLIHRDLSAVRLDSPHPVGGTPVSEAFHLAIFHQPLRNRFFDSLYGCFEPALWHNLTRNETFD